MASYFQYKFFLREIVLDGPWGKRMYHVIWTEIKERCDPQVNSFIWIFSTENIHNGNAYFEIIEKGMNAQFQTI